MGKTIFLVGARAAGKTTVGKQLAKQLNFTFVDTDQQLVELLQQSVAEIVAHEGWQGFRARESSMLRHCAIEQQVVATGGGIVLSAQNRDFMQQHGLVFYLYAPATVLTERLAADPQTAQRPALTEKSLAEEVEQILCERDPLYRAAAHYVIDATLPQTELLQQICSHIVF